MSTTFEVYPGSKSIATFRSLLEKANLRINSFLSEIGMNESVCFDVSILQIRNHKRMDFGPDNKVQWPEDCFAWFAAKGVGGGIDAYYNSVAQIDKDRWAYEIEHAAKPDYIPLIKRSLEIGHYWYFRRSIGQPASICLAYGILAATLAELTDGFIFTDDGAWDTSLFPAKAEDFFKWYFRAESASADDKAFTEECLEKFKLEFI